MKRRDFLSRTGLAGAGMASLLAAGCQTQDGATTTQADKKNALTDFPLQETTIEKLQQEMQASRISSEQITREYLNRINEVDRSGPRLNAIIELNPDALETARALDAERKAGKLRGPLHGIPILVKDNIDTGDKMQTTAGALAMEGNIASRDAFVIGRLRAAGVVILGKTNLSEWANFRSSSSCSGWSSRGGQTKSPYVLDHNPCGSSSGSGAAVSANLCVVAVGTETDGSVTCPASVNGIVGLKPTVGLVSRTGIIPISATQDTAGPMGRTVKDVAILLGAMTGTDAEDERSKQAAGKAHPDYTKFLDPQALQGKRIGIDKRPLSENQYLKALLAKSKDLIRKQGGEIVELDYMDKIDALGKAEFLIMLYEFKDGLTKYLASSNAKMKSLADVIAFNIKNEDRAMPYFRQETLVEAEKKGGLETREYLDAYKKCHLGSRKILDDIFEKNKLDAIGGLTMGPSCSIDMIYGDRWGGSLTSPAAISGYPHISFPAGLVYGMPVGFSFFGPAFSEPALLAMAYAFEQASGPRVPPSFKQSFLA